MRRKDFLACYPELFVGRTDRECKRDCCCSFSASKYLSILYFQALHIFIKLLASMSKKGIVYAAIHVDSFCSWRDVV